MQQKRGISENIQYLLATFPVVIVLGARQVGKSTLLKQCLPAAPYFDLERESDFLRISSDVEGFFRVFERETLVLDEAQTWLPLFGAIRVEVDRDRGRRGRFLLSGSSSPALLRGVADSLAGRCAIVELSGFAWHEALSLPVSPFYDALESPDSLRRLSPRYTPQQLDELLVFGSYPEPYLRRAEPGFHGLWMENYIKTYVERDVRALFPGLNFLTFKKMLGLLAHATGDLLNASEFARSLDVSQPTIKLYLDIIESTFLWRRLSSYEASAVKSTVKMPRGHLRDTGLILYWLKLTDAESLRIHPKFGRIWEAFVIEQISRCLQAKSIRHDLFFYRTRNQAEIDLLVEGPFGLIPIEIKSGYNVDARQLRTLTDFVKANNCPVGLVINNSDEVVPISDRILQIPARCL